MTDENTQIISMSTTKAKDKSFACLIVIAGANAGQMYRLKAPEITIGRSHENTIPILEEGVSRGHCRLHNLAGGEIMLEDLNSTNGTFVNGETINRRLLEDGDKIQIGTTTILKFTYHDSIEENFQKQMFESALRDGLTTAYNKRYFTERFNSEYSYSLRHKFPLSLLIIDLDLFKNVNDTYGHLAGDAVLIELTKRMHTAIRSEDVFARYGGEEFAIIARGISHENGLLMAERMRRIISDRPFEFDELSLNITASFGLCSIPYHKALTPLQMIEFADKALYEAKRSGRNRVCSL